MMKSEPFGRGSDERGRGNHTDLYCVGEALKKKAVLRDAQLLSVSGIVNQSRYRTKTIPSAGSLLKEEDSAEKQQSFEV